MPRAKRRGERQRSLRGWDLIIEFTVIVTASVISGLLLVVLVGGHL